MALAMRISNLSARAMLDALVDRVDGGAGAGICRIYDGAQATDPDTAVGAQVLLATLTFSDPAFGAAADAAPGAIATANAITADASADATGTASWFRVLDSTPTAHWDGSVGTGTHDMVVNTTAFVAGAEVAISSWTVTMPES